MKDSLILEHLLIHQNLQSIAFGNGGDILAVKIIQLRKGYLYVQMEEEVMVAEHVLGNFSYKNWLIALGYLSLYHIILQALANGIRLSIRMFSFISMNWKGKPLENYEAIVKLISATTTKSGLRVKAKLDKKEYKKNIKITDDKFEKINLRFSNKFPKWNYTILPF